MGRMVLVASALGMKHLVSKIKRLLQEPAKDLEFNTSETRQKALIETSDSDYVCAPRKGLWLLWLFTTVGRRGVQDGECGRSQDKGARSSG